MGRLDCYVRSKEGVKMLENGSQGSPETYVDIVALARRLELVIGSSFSSTQLVHDSRSTLNAHRQEIGEVQSMM